MPPRKLRRQAAVEEAAVGGVNMAMASPFEYTTRRQVYEQQGTPSTLEAVKVMGGAIAGALTAGLLIAKVFPQQRVLTALAVLSGGAVLGATSPVASIPESVGMGAAVGGALFLGLEITNEIRSPSQVASAGTAGTAAALQAPARRSAALHQASAVAVRGLAR